jgi:hypothetical protein
VRRQRGLGPWRRVVRPQAVGTARDAGCTGTLVARADSAFCSAAFTGAVRECGACFSVTVPMNPHVQAAIAAIGPGTWTPVRYPRAIWDDQLGCWVSDAEVAETEYTAFAAKKTMAITARLIVRRVKDLSRTAEGQDELFTIWRYHAIFTDSPFGTLQAKAHLAVPGCPAVAPVVRGSTGPGLFFLVVGRLGAGQPGARACRRVIAVVSWVAQGQVAARRSRRRRPPRASRPAAENSRSRSRWGSQAGGPVEGEHLHPGRPPPSLRRAGPARRS